MNRSDSHCRGFIGSNESIAEIVPVGTEPSNYPGTE